MNPQFFILFIHSTMSVQRWNRWAFHGVLTRSKLLSLHVFKEGQLGFSFCFVVLAIFYNGFLFLPRKIAALLSNGVCGFWFFWHLVFTFWQKY